MKRRQFRHKYKTLKDIMVKKQVRSNVWKFTSFETLQTTKGLSWSEMNRRHKKQRPATERRNVKFRSEHKKLRFSCQNVIQSQSRKEHGYI